MDAAAHAHSAPALAQIWDQCGLYPGYRKSKSKSAALNVADKNDGPPPCRGNEWSADVPVAPTTSGGRSIPVPLHLNALLPKVDMDIGTRVFTGNLKNTKLDVRHEPERARPPPTTGNLTDNHHF